MDYNEALKIVSSSDTAEKEEKLKEYENKLNSAIKTFNSRGYITIIISAFLLSGTFIFFYLGNSDMLSRLLVMRKILTALIIVPAALGVGLLLAKSCVVGSLKKKMSAAEQALNSDIEVTDSMNAECSKLYEMCVSNGVTELNADNTSSFMLIAKQLGITDPAQAKQRFERGYALCVIEMTEQADEYLKQAQEQSALVGKYKYTAYARNQALKYKGYADRDKVTETMAQTLATVAKGNKPRDWGTAGGLASAALGPAAGVAVAASIQQQNQRDAEHAANTLKGTSKTIEMSQERYKGHMKSYGEWEHRITEINALIADEDEKYFQNVSLTAYIVSITPAGTMKVRVRSQIKKYGFELLGKPALIDGSFTLYVCENGRRIGSTIVCAPDFDSIECKKMGYGSAVMTALCRPFEGEKFSAEAEYSFEFESIHTWAIQKW